MVKNSFEPTPIFNKHGVEIVALRTQAPVKGIEMPVEFLNFIEFQVRKALSDCTPELSAADAIAIGTLIIGRIARAYPIDKRLAMFDRLDFHIKEHFEAQA